MSVYTSLSHVQIELFISAYGLTPLVAYSGISAGIENTNYFLKTSQGEFILTLYENFTVGEISSYMDLLVQLGKHESYYPSPLLNFQQGHLQLLAGKPTALFKCLSGKSVIHATLNQCELVARALARLHLSSPGFEFNIKNARNIEWIQTTALQVRACVSLQDSVLLEDEVKFQLKHSTGHLPHGVIHADLFKDNVLFVGDRFTGMLDFYAACRDSYLLDVAIALNDWCVDEQGRYSRKQQDVFMHAYRQVREVLHDEECYLSILLRRACLRFWLSRLKHKLEPKRGEITQEKDPEQFKSLLLQHRNFYRAQ